eukprot:UN11131
MSLTINCPKTNAFQVTTITIFFIRSWSMDFKYTSLNGMKGKISRAIQCKAALDEVNYPYGTDARSNMTFVASYSMLLGNIGFDYDAQYNYVKEFDNYWNNAQNEVQKLDEFKASIERFKFCNDAYNTILL